MTDTEHHLKMVEQLVIGDVWVERSAWVEIFTESYGMKPCFACTYAHGGDPCQPEEVVAVLKHVYTPNSYGYGCCGTRRLMYVVVGECGHIIYWW